MSNIVLKGDVVQNLGEYLPNVYIERIQVSEELRAGFPFIDLNVFYSILFLIDDDYNIEDIKDSLLDINFFCSFGSSSAPEKKITIIEKYLNSTSREVYETVRDFINGSEVASLLNNDQNYQDDLYDHDGRRILKISGQVDLSLVKFSDIKDNNLYFYVFSSLLQQTIDFQLSSGNNTDILYLNTSNFAYEKVLSPNLNVLREEEMIYLDSGGAKYGQVPLLGLNRQYYKTTTVTREEIISKVNTLVRRFDTLSEGPLSDSVTAIKYVLSTQADTENLLVELDKVRRSFPNKTNNNPVGNLYASYTKLLQNINSAFLPSEIVTKERYLTGKVFDLRTGLTRGYEPPEPTDSPSYIPEEMFFIHRERKSEDDVEDDFAINRGIFFIRYEEMLKRESNIGKLIDINKLYETVSDQDLDDLKRILFSYFRIKRININKLHNDNLMSNFLFLYNTERDNRKGVTYGGPQTPYQFYADSTYNGSSTEVDLREYNFRFDNPSERMLCYSFTDSDTFSAIYEENEIDINGAMVFDYEIDADFYDDTNKFITYLIKKFDDIKDSLDQYASLAQEICSYNNIDNRFNDFFVNSIREQFPTGVYPWESAPAIYAVMAYVLTTNFETFEDAIRYSKNVTATISPENGSLESLVNFTDRMYELRSEQISDLETDNDNLSAGSYTPQSLNKEVSLRPLNYVQLLSEADAEFESLIAASPITVASIDGVTEDGMLKFGNGRLSSYDNTIDFYNKLLELLKITLNHMIDKEKIDNVAAPFGIGISPDSFQTFLNVSKYFQKQTEQEILKPLGVFVDALNLYFKAKRNLSLKQNGLNYPFDYGVYTLDSVNGDDGTREIVANFLNSMNQNFISSWGGTFMDGVFTFDENVDNTVNILVRDILNYYRLNTDKLMIDLSKAGFAFATAADDANNELKQKINNTIITEATNMVSFDVYTGPELNEIAGYEDIVVRDN